MELRDRIADIIGHRFRSDQGGFLSNGEELADAILDIPEIKNALKAWEFATVAVKATGGGVEKMPTDETFER